MYGVNRVNTPIQIPLSLGSNFAASTNQKIDMKKVEVTVVKTGENQKGFWALVRVKDPVAPFEAFVNTNELLTEGDEIKVPEMALRGR